MAFSPISKEVMYRIQNLGRATFLELDDDEPATLRPLKDTTKQQWKFVACDGSTFKIQNADDNESYLDIKSNTAVCREASSQLVTWSISSLRDSPGVYVLGNNKSYLQYSKSDNRVDVAKVNRRGTETDDQKWRIIEATSSVRALIPASVTLDDSLSYRIRNLYGAVVLDLSKEANSNIVTAKRLDTTNEYQRWKIKAKGNDKYEITNTGKYNANNYSNTPGGFLGCDEIGKGNLLRGVGAFEWELSSVGGLAYALRTKSQKHNEILTISVAEYQPDDSNKVVLASADTVTLDHLWILEPWKSQYGAAQLGGVPTWYPQYPGSYGAPGVHTGLYELRNCAYPYLYLRVSSNPRKVYPEFYSGTEILVTFTSSKFFTMTAAAEKLPILVADNVLSIGSAPSSWYIEQESNLPGYYICLSGTATPKVIGATDARGATLNFQVVDKKNGEKAQMWELLGKT